MTQSMQPLGVMVGCRTGDFERVEVGGAVRAGDKVTLGWCAEDDKVDWGISHRDSNLSLMVTGSQGAGRRGVLESAVLQPHWLCRKQAGNGEKGGREWGAVHGENAQDFGGGMCT